MTSVLVFDCKQRNPLGFLARLVADTLAAAPGIEDCRLAGAWDIGRALGARRYDVILVFGGEQLTRELVHACQARCDQLLLWTTEDPYELDQILPLAESFDRVFSNDAAAARLYPRGEYLPLGFPDAFAARLARLPKQIDFVYLGRGWPNRTQILGQVLDASEGLSRVVRVTDPVGAVAHRAGVTVGPNLPYTSYLTQIAAARTCLIVTRDHSTNPGPHSRSRSVSPPPRFFECLGLRTIPVVLGERFAPDDLLAPAGAIYCPTPEDLGPALREAMRMTPAPAETAARFSLSRSIGRLVEVMNLRAHHHA